jgi:hypothetical protein
MEYNNQPQHVAVLADTITRMSGLNLIHAVHGKGVIEHGWRLEHRRSTIAVYRLFDFCN